MRSALFCVAVLILASGGLRADEFNQWRGPQRNGIVPNSPMLSGTWPKSGPRKIWQSEEIPGGGAGGYGSVVVANGQVYLYVNWKYRVPLEHRTLTEGNLKRLGWSKQKLPEALKKTVEEARLGEERAKVIKKELKAWMAKWVAEHLKTEEENKKFGKIVTDRLWRGKKALHLDVLAKLEAIKDKRFADQKDLDKWYAENDISEEQKKAVTPVIPTYVGKAWDVVMCLDDADGKTLWKAKTEGKVSGHGTSTTPCIVNDRCYVAASDGDVYCLDVKTGKEIWKTRAAAKGGQVNSSVLVADGVVVVLAASLTALDAKNGSVLWRQAKVTGRNNSPVIWTGAEKASVICNTGKNVGCVDLKTGELLWTVPGGGYTTAAVAGNIMAVCTGRKKVGLLAYKISLEKAEKLWSAPEYVGAYASPIIHNGHVYAIGSGRAMCVNLDSGKVVWNEKLGGGCGSSILADGKIFVTTGGLKVIEATGAKYNLLGKAKVYASGHTSSAIANGRLYVRMGKAVACYDLTVPPATQAAKGK